MNTRRPVDNTGFSLIEMMISILVLAIISLGSISYQLYTVQQTNQSDTKMAAARIGSLVIENWKSTGGSNVYDPAQQDLGVVKLENDDIYKVYVDNIPYYLSYSFEDIDNNETTGVTLRELRVFVQWCDDCGDRIPADSDPSTTIYNYVRRDQSGG